MKNFEAVFLAAIVMTTFTAFATAEVPVTRTAKPAISAQAAQDNMQVVVIKAKRLTAAEKAALN
ncbi:MAG: hypothetical protein V4723_20125 [Pseudomonadota bacterium]